MRQIDEDDGVKFILGYVQKYRGHADARRFVLGYTEAECEEAFEFYMARRRSPMTGRKSLSKSNLHGEMFKFYREHIYPLPPPRFNQMLVFMISSGKCMPNSAWSQANGRLDMKQASTMCAMWLFMHHPDEATPENVATLFTKSEDALDDSRYVGTPFLDLCEQAKHRREELHDTNGDFWRRLVH